MNGILYTQVHVGFQWSSWNTWKRIVVYIQDVGVSAYINIDAGTT